MIATLNFAYSIDAFSYFCKQRWMLKQSKTDQKKGQPPHLGPTGQNMWGQLVRKEESSHQIGHMALNSNPQHWHGLYCSRLMRSYWTTWYHKKHVSCNNFFVWMNILEYWQFIRTREGGCPWILSDWQNWRSLSGASRVTGKRERGNDLSHTHWQTGTNTGTYTGTYTGTLAHW